MTEILVVAAHPDDEVLGCAGTIAKHTKNGDRVHILFLADGVGARGNKEGLDRRRAAANAAAEIMGAEAPEFLDFPDNRMDSVDLLDVTQEVEKRIGKVKPEIIYTHYNNDLNVDHCVTYQAVMTACRPMPGQTVNRILSFEVASSTGWQSANPSLNFSPNWFVDISDMMSIKKKAIEAYSEEMRDFPHVRSYKAVEALAVWRGAFVGVEAAEAFNLERNVS